MLCYPIGVTSWKTARWEEFGEDRNFSRVTKMSICGQMLITNQAQELKTLKGNNCLGLSSKAWEVLGAGTCFPKENGSSHIELDREASVYIKCSQN